MMDGVKPPIPVVIKNLSDFARLALALTESPPLLWHFKIDRKSFLGLLSIYTFWKGDLPIFAYVRLKEKPQPFLAYKSDGEYEKYFFVNNVEDTRYVYAPIISLKNPPEIFVKLLSGKTHGIEKPLKVELDSLNSLIRLLYLIFSRDYVSFPIWRFKIDGKWIVGAYIPFERYYESNALPLFFYVRLRRVFREPFLRYTTSKLNGEQLEYCVNTSETRFFYVKVIDVKDMPLFPS